MMRSNGLNRPPFSVAIADVILYPRDILDARGSLVTDGLDEEDTGLEREFIAI